MEEKDWPHMLTWLLLAAVLVFLFIIAADACYQHEAVREDVDWLEGDLQRAADLMHALRSLIYERCVPLR